MLYQCISVAIAKPVGQQKKNTHIQMGILNMILNNRNYRGGGHNDIKKENVHIPAHVEPPFT